MAKPSHQIKNRSVRPKKSRRVAESSAAEIPKSQKNLSGINAQIDIESRNYWADKAEHWTEHQWSVWLLDGLLSWHFPRPTTSRALAFDALPLNSEDDPIPQIISELNRERSLASNFTRGLRLALRAWAPQFTVRVLQDLLHLAEEFSVDEAGAGTEGVASLVRRPIVLDTIQAIDDEAGRVEAVSQIITTIAAADWTEDSEKLIDELVARRLWQSSFLGQVLIARIRLDRSAWLVHLRHSFDELTLGYPGSDRALLLENVIVTVGLKTAILGLAEMVAQRQTKEFLREILAIFLLDDPVIHVPANGEHFKVEFDEFPKPVCDDHLLADAEFIRKFTALIDCLHHIQRCMKHDVAVSHEGNVRDLVGSGSKIFDLGPADIKLVLGKLAA